ncbi:hypothetical protein NTGZN8_140092 [Candidatus Nitrotoga fabula]|uniref:Uncharacterized protein n=1 Tax=Candidatus Nitrotoga fabula TaxID=2182327 RepID=A0A916BB59_9PROT|nr:hypothetical protein NTGZN8_140092 [Candidatus Nitrotoga fabula]
MHELTQPINAAVADSLPDRLPAWGNGTKNFTFGSQANTIAPLEKFRAAPI